MASGKPGAVQSEDSSSPLDAEELMAASEMYPKQTASLLRKNLRDGFHERFRTRLAFMKSQLPPDSGVLEKHAELEDFICLKQTSRALGILTAQFNSADLDLVRQVMDSWKLDLDQILLTYLGRFGAWEDVERILKLEIRGSSSGNTLLGLSLMPTQGNIESIALTLYRIGRGRFIDLLNKIEDSNIKAAILAAASKKTISGLHEDVILKLLKDGNERVRKTTVLRLLDATPKSKVSGLLEKYLSTEQPHYYNVIHWLDLGSSMPTDITRKIVLDELQ